LGRGCPSRSAFGFVLFRFVEGSTSPRARDRSRTPALSSTPEFGRARIEVVGQLLGATESRRVSAVDLVGCDAEALPARRGEGRGLGTSGRSDRSGRVWGRPAIRRRGSTRTLPSSTSSTDMLASGCSTHLSRSRTARLHDQREHCKNPGHEVVGLDVGPGPPRRSCLPGSRVGAGEGP
jgi:hypothetical protein